MIKKLQPKLRFRGFTDAWEQRKLGNIMDSYSGGTPAANNSSYYGGEIPFIRSAEIDDDSTALFLTQSGLSASSAKWVKKGDVLYALYGANSGNASFAKLDGVINQAVLAIKPKEGFYNAFLMYWLQKNKRVITATFLQGGQGNLSGSIVKKLSIHTPRIEEQERIGILLIKIDDLIAAEKRKLNLLKDKKTALLQQIFNRKLRSKDHDDSWEPRKLGDVATLVKKRNKKLDVLHVYTISAERGVIPQTDYFERNIVSKGRLGNYLIVNHDDFIYNPRISSEAPYGPVRRNDNLDKGVVSPLYTVFSIQNAYPLFIEYFFKSDIWHQFMQLNGNVGARSDRFAINDLSLMEMPIYLPELKEQKVIGNLFKKLDELISCEEKRIKLLAGKKSALMNQMFI